MNLSPVESGRMVVVVMGVSGSGKSTVGASVADVLGLQFVDGDSLHSPAGVARMQSGVPLSDEDRWPWLDRIGKELADAPKWPAGVVIACSALKRSYRDRIRALAPGVRFIFLHGSSMAIEARLTKRSGHYMPTSLLESQFKTLEPPSPGESDVFAFSIEPPISNIVADAVRHLTDGR